MCELEEEEACAFFLLRAGPGISETERNARTLEPKGKFGLSNEKILAWIWSLLRA